LPAEDFVPTRYEYQMAGRPVEWSGRLTFAKEEDRDRLLSSLFRSVRDIPNPKLRAEITGRVKANYQRGPGAVLLIREKSVRIVLDSFKARGVLCIEVAR
jgi:hypothetical protein